MGKRSCSACKRIGLSCVFFNGEEEAIMACLARSMRFHCMYGVVVDIGGGSAQVSQICNRRFVQGQALTLGALALSERSCATTRSEERDQEYPCGNQSATR
jgi:exopolyphosphatase/pppGpp-phosphohydrolase